MNSLEDSKLGVEIVSVWFTLFVVVVGDWDSLVIVIVTESVSSVLDADDDEVMISLDFVVGNGRFVVGSVLNAIVVEFDTTVVVVVASFDVVAFVVVVAIVVVVGIGVGAGVGGTVP
jgi:hypothetical protein